MNEESGPSLKEYMETRLNLLTVHLQDIEKRINAQMAEADVRYSQRFQGQQEAIAKSDMASEKRFEAVNEFRKTLTDQTATFIPRAEAVLKMDGVADRVTKIESLLYTSGGSTIGQKEYRIEKRSDVSMVISILMAVIGTGALIISFIKGHP